MNTHDNVLLASNVLHAVRSSKRNTDPNDLHFIENNVYFANTDSESDLLRENV